MAEPNESKQMNRILKLAALLAVSTFANPVFSASVLLLPEDAVVEPGSLQVELVLEASDVADGCVPRCSGFSGEVEISYDADDLRLVSVTPVAPAVVVSDLIFEDPFVVPEDGIGPVSFGFREALEQGTVAVLEFMVVAEPGDTVSIGVADNWPILGTFEYAFPTNQFFTPDFFGAEVQVVPAPAAAWLFLSALAAFATRARRAG